MFEIKKPNMNVEESEDRAYAKIVMEPLEKGFGMTIGNCLRRILLSDLPGAAIQGVKFLEGGVKHEFSAIEGVREDVTEIILNLKSLAIETTVTEDNYVKVLRLYAQGPMDVTAGDISKDAEIRIINENQHICTLDEGGVIDMEITVGRGRGYKGADHTTTELIDYIPIDSIYTPVQKVNYTVENTRVDQSLDFDKLTLEVWTNGATKAKEVVSLAAKIMQEYIGLFVGLSETREDARIFEEPAPDSDLEELLKTPIEELQLSVRSYNCLKRANIQKVGDLVEKTEDEMLKVRNLGQKSLEEVKDKLKDRGLSLFVKKED